MKGIACKDMGGVCDTVIHGNTASEVALRAMDHYQESGDDQHRAIVTKIKASTSEETHQWRTKFGEQFDAAPEMTEK